MRTHRRKHITPLTLLGIFCLLMGFAISSQATHPCGCCGDPCCGVTCPTGYTCLGGCCEGGPFYYDYCYPGSLADPGGLTFCSKIIRASDPVVIPAVVGTTFNPGQKYQDEDWDCSPTQTEYLGPVTYSPVFDWYPDDPAYLNTSWPGTYSFDAYVYGVSSDSDCPYNEDEEYVGTYTVTVVGVSSVSADADVVCAGGSVALTAYPYPDVAWPAGTPTWTVSPGGAGSVAAGAGGTAIFTAAADFSDTAIITAHCGTSEQDYTLTDSEVSIGSTLYYPVVDISDDISLKLTASDGTTPYTWTTSDPSVATAPVFILSMPADDICEIIGHAPGSADITATDHKGCKATRTVTIIQLTSSQSDLWWFNGATPANYALNTVGHFVGTLCRERTKLSSARERPLARALRSTMITP